GLHLGKEIAPGLLVWAFDSNQLRQHTFCVCQLTGLGVSKSQAIESERIRLRLALELVASRLKFSDRRQILILFEQRVTQRGVSHSGIDSKPVLRSRSLRLGQVQRLARVGLGAWAGCGVGTARIRF